MNAIAIFEQKPAFGRGMMGIRAAAIGGCPLAIYEWDEFKPFLMFRALDNLDFWERFAQIMHAYTPPESFVLDIFGLPSLNDLLADELLDLDAAEREKLWRDTEARLTAYAEQGHGFAQKLLGDYYGQIREGGLGADVGKALYWYGEAAKSGINSPDGDCERMDESEFGDDVEPFLFCGAYSSDDSVEKELPWSENIFARSTFS